MRKSQTMVCLLMVALAGCNQPAPEETATSPISIPGTGEQLITLRLPGMT